jgi:aspartate aminotransferase
MNWAEHCVIEASFENDFMPTAEQVAPYIRGASLLCLCTPQNPTGTTLDKTELEKICELVIEENNRRGETEKKLYVMFDQIYWLLTYGNTQHYNPITLRKEMKAYTIFVDGISKCFASTGLRLGWAAGPVKVIGKMKAFLSHIGAWAPMAEQKATAKFLMEKEAIDTFLITFKRGLEERLNKIYDGFLRLKNKGFSVDAVAPQAAIYLTIKIDISGKKVGDTVLKTQAEVTEYILREAKLAVVPFYAFGASKQSPWYRLSVGTCKLEEVDEMFSKLESALAKVN